jgi:hypothetical protein
MGPSLLLSDQIAINQNAEDCRTKSSEPTLPDLHDLNLMIADPTSPTAPRRKAEMCSKVPWALEGKDLISYGKLGPAAPVVTPEPCQDAVHFEIYVHG